MRAIAEEQISAFLANKSGAIADLCSTLTEHGVSVRAITILETVDIGTTRMLVDDVETAKAALKEAGAAFVVVPVVTVKMPHVAGAVGAVARSMANHGINIEYLYATAVADSDASLGVFRVSDCEKALEIEFDL